MNEPMNPLQSIADFAKARDVTTRTVNNWLAAARLPGAKKVGGRWLIPADATLQPPAGAADVAEYRPAELDAVKVSEEVMFRPKSRPIPIEFVAREFGVPVATIRRWARAGEGGLSLSTGPTGAHYVWIVGA